MRSFSETYGYAPERKIQIDSMDDDLKRRIRDVIYEHDGEIPIRAVWTGWVKRDVSELDGWATGTMDTLLKKISETQAHNEVYDLIQIIVQNMEAHCVDTYGSEGAGCKSEFVDDMNAVLEENRSGWRIDGETIVPVMGENELEAIHEAASISDAIEQCAKRAMAAMDMSSPAYDSSIMQSAKMAESVLDMVGGEGKGTGTKLDSVAEGRGIPGEIVESFKRTNDFANRFARHPNKESDYEAGRSDAILVLVQFAAMSNYVYARWRAVGRPGQPRPGRGGRPRE